MTRKSKTTWSRTTKELPAGSHQALVAILRCLSELERETSSPVLRDALSARLPEFLASHAVVTSQKPKRVLYYWRKFLVNEGYVSVGRAG